MKRAPAWGQQSMRGTYHGSGQACCTVRALDGLSGFTCVPETPPMATPTSQPCASIDVVGWVWGVGVWGCGGVGVWGVGCGGGGQSRRCIRYRHQQAVTARTWTKPALGALDLRVGHTAARAQEARGAWARAQCTGQPRCPSISPSWAQGTRDRTLRLPRVYTQRHTDAQHGHPGRGLLGTRRPSARNLPSHPHPPRCAAVLMPSETAAERGRDTEGRSWQRVGRGILGDPRLHKHSL